MTFARFLSLIWPPGCPVCGRTLARHESPLCLDCLSRLTSVNGHTQLTYVGAPFDTVNLVSWFMYDNDSTCRTLIHHIKYHDMPRLARALGRELAVRQLADAGVIIDVILPVPLHWTKYVKRGYNQTKEIALGVADITGAKVWDNLYASRPHATQTQRNRLERADNVEGIFSLRHPEQLDRKHIAVLDDVITTGATLYSALQAILSVSSPASVTFLTLARTNRS